MVLNEAKLRQALEQPLTQSVFYYCSTEEYLVRSYAAKTIARLMQAQDAEVTRIEGPSPSLDEIVAAAGTISFFGTKRIVELAGVLPSAMTDAEVAALCDVLESMENAVVVMTTTFLEEKASGTKKAKLLQEAAHKQGIVAQLVKPQAQDARAFAIEHAASLGAQLLPKEASLLVERCGMDFFTLEQEVSKLSAAVGYKTITQEIIASMGTQSIEADVFEMVRMVTSRQTARALAHLQRLLNLQNEPIAITAALSGSFVDMYRVKCGAQQKRTYGTVHKDFKYRGSDYRLKKSTETAAAYSKAQLEQILELLRRLDASLKSSMANGTVLLQTTLCQIAALGGRP